jgi:hypothetical protein
LSPGFRWVTPSPTLSLILINIMATIINNIHSNQMSYF